MFVALGVGLKVERPSKSGPEAVETYRQQVAEAVKTIVSQEESFSAAARNLKDEIAQSGGEEAAEAVLLAAIEEDQSVLGTEEG